MSLARLLLAESPLRLRGRLARLAILLWPGAAIATPYGPRLVKRQADLTFRLAVTGAYGRFISDLIDKRSEPFHFIDIGANQGIYTLLAAHHSSCLGVVAFEPTPDTFAYLTRNIALNRAPRVSALCAAVAPDDTPVVRLSRNERHSGAASMVSGNGDTVAIAATGDVLRAVWPPADGAFQLLKIDVEGAECIVLDALGAAGVLDRVDGVIVELNDDSAGAGHGDKVSDRLHAAGFTEAARSPGTTHCDAYFVRAAAIAQEAGS